MTPAAPTRRQALGRLGGLAAAALAPTAPTAFAQAPYPSKPITLVMPFPAGGSFDPIFRALTDAAARDLGQPIVLMPRPGAGGVTAPAGVATMSEADGYTLTLMHNSVIRAPLVQKVAFDPLRDFTYLGNLFGLTTAVAVAADAPWKTLADLLADAKKRPGEISYGTVGAISVNRIMAERLARSVGTRFNMIPFKGGGEAWTSLIGRQLDVYGDPGFGPQAKGGKVRLLASFTDRRLARFPDVPTVRELGHDFVIESPVGLVAPKGLDAKVVARLAAAFQKAAKDPAYLAQLEAFDMQPQIGTPEAHAAYARAQFEREHKLLAEIGFKPE